MDIDHNPAIAAQTEVMEFEYTGEGLVQVPETPGCSQTPSAEHVSPDDGPATSLTQILCDCAQAHSHHIERLEMEIRVLEEKSAEHAQTVKKARFHEAELQQAKNELDKLKAENNRLRTRVHEALGPEGLTALKMLFDNDTQVSDLKKQVRELEGLVPREADKRDLSSVDLRDIEKQRLGMCDNLAGLFSGQDYAHMHQTLEIEPHSDLRYLCQRVKLLDDVQSPEIGCGEIIQLTEDVAIVCRALVGAAVCSWVFETNLKVLLPDLGLGDHSAPQSRLLQKYKGALASKGTPIHNGQPATDAS